MKLDTHGTINVHLKRVRRNADGSQTVIDESNSSRAIDTNSAAMSRVLARFRLDVVLLMVSIGAALLAYGAADARSDARAARAYHGSPSCDLAALAPANPAPTTPGACRLEHALVVRRDRHIGRSGKPVYLTILSPDGRLDDTNLLGADAVALWRRVAPNQRIMVQRFVDSGYHLTGAITALSDGHGVALSDAHPDARPHSAAVNIALGAGLLVLGLLTYARRRRP